MFPNSAQLYLCTDARLAQGDFAEFVDAAFAGGVDIIQLRDKTLEAAAVLEKLAILRDAAARHRACWAVNDRADIARLAGADILHGGQGDLRPAQARNIVGADVGLGLSTHSSQQVDAARSDLLLSYYCVGPVWSTPTKPGRSAVGIDLIRYAASVSRGPGAKPWFAIGGVDEQTVGEIVAAGASRIVVVRAITHSADPTAAAQRLRAALPPIAAQVPYSDVS